MSDAQAFVHTEVDNRVVFGSGTRWRIPEEVKLLDVTRVMVISGPRSREVAEDLAGACGDRCIGVLPQAAMHVPAELADRTAEVVAGSGADGLVAVGGGSAIGLAKAVARRREVPILAVPTSYAGSEMTPIWGETHDGAKTTGKSSSVKPRTVIYDVELTVSLSRELTVTSGVNAVAHAVEGLYAPDASPLRQVVAEEGIRKAVAALPRVVTRADDTDARAEMLQAAWMCGTVLGSTTMGLHHKVCHVLGGSLNLPHAETHTVLLPHVMAFNLVAGEEAWTRAARAIGDTNPGRELWKRIRALRGPMSLRELGMAHSDIGGVVTQVAAASTPNPRAVHPDDLTGLLERALVGAEPEVA